MNTESANNVIDAALRATGLSMQQLGERLGYKSLSRAYSGEIPLPEARRIHLEDLVTLSRHYGENTNFVSSPVETVKAGLVGQKPGIDLPSGMSARLVPLLSFAQAGQYEVAHGDEAWAGDGFIAFNVEDRKAFALQIEGDSMTPQIAHGDVVVVSPGGGVKRGDEVVVKTTDGEVFCKVWGGESAGAVVLMSYNAAHVDLRIPRDQIAWIYPVVQKTSLNKR